MPIEPPPTEWELPDPRHAPEGALVGMGADLAPGTVLAAYRRGLFPMPIEGRLGWWSPDPRAVLPLDGLRVSRSLRRSCRRFEIRVDTACEAVITACADPRRSGGWITGDIRATYLQLHRMGWVHSVEAWQGDALAGGLYGVCVGGLFAGESMFHRVSDASKVALVALVEILNEAGATLLDVQWMTGHLASLGVVEVSRSRYLDQLRLALTEPQALP